MKSKQALQRAESKLAEITPGQRAELLTKAGIGPTAQARVLGAAFRMLEKAVSAENSIRVGKGGNSRLAKRPDWPTRVASSRTLIEWLAPVVRQSAAQPGAGKVQVAVVLPGYASGQAEHVEGVVVRSTDGA